MGVLLLILGNVAARPQVQVVTSGDSFALKSGSTYLVRNPSNGLIEASKTIGKYATEKEATQAGLEFYQQNYGMTVEGPQKYTTKTGKDFWYVLINGMYLHKDDTLQKSANSHGNGGFYTHNRLAANQAFKYLNEKYDNAPEKLVSPATELKAALDFLYSKNAQGIPRFDEYTIQNIRFFTTFTLPDKLRKEAPLTLSFVCHSLIGPNEVEKRGIAGGYYPLAVQRGEEIEYTRAVPGSDTLFWINLEEFNWTAEAWEKAALQDGYFISQALNYADYKHATHNIGNIILRADWFISHTTDVTYQSDRKEKNVLYWTFLYAKAKKNPKTLDEFRKVWGVDTKALQEQGLQYGTLVTRSKTVSRHNRILNSARSSYGNYYETSDVLFEEGERNYVDNIPLNKPEPKVSDANEAITNNIVGMQVYDLFDGEGKQITDANGGIVRDNTHAPDDFRVRTARSCISCHPNGILDSENSLARRLKEGVKLKIYDLADKRDVDRIYLSNRFDGVVKDGQNIYARAMSGVNGMTPEANAALYRKVMDWYEKPVTLEQAAKEVGLSEQDFIKKVRGSISGDLTDLVTTREPVSRYRWESVGVDGATGLYGQCIAMIHGVLPVVQKQVVQQVVQQYYALVKYDNTPVYTEGTNVFAVIPQGTKLEIVEPRNQDGWVVVRVNGRKVWIKREAFAVRIQ